VTLSGFVRYLRFVRYLLLVYLALAACSAPFAAAGWALAHLIYG
jgi:hypothetical protein